MTMANGWRFHFVVPVLSKVMAGRHWHRNDNPDGRSAEQAVSRCLSSLCNQNVSCVIHLVCHEVPKFVITPGVRVPTVVELCEEGHHDYTKYLTAGDPVIVIHEVDFPRPPDIDLPTYNRLSGKVLDSLPDLNRRKIGDKYSKIKVGLNATFRDPAAHFVMFIDHDDMVHREVAEYALEHDGLFPGGHTVTSGYGYTTGKEYFREMSGFHKSCGSCNAVRLSDWEKEQWMATHDVNTFDRKTHWLFAGHSSVYARLRKEGRNTEKFPFRAAVYVNDTGANFSGTVRAGKGRVDLTDDIRRQFGMLA